MTPEQESELAALKAALKQHIEEAEKATLGPWECCALDEIERPMKRTITTHGSYYDANFIARARTMSPLACRIALAGVRALEEIASEDKAQGYVADLGADCDLNLILSIWKGGNP